MGGIGLDAAEMIELPGQGLSFVAAGVAFAVDIVVSIAVSLGGKPKPVAELVGLVYSATPKDMLTDADALRLPWYRRPVPMAGIGLALVITLNIVFL